LGRSAIIAVSIFLVLLLATVLASQLIKDALEKRDRTEATTRLQVGTAKLHRSVLFAEQLTKTAAKSIQFRSFIDLHTFTEVAEASSPHFVPIQAIEWIPLLNGLEKEFIESQVSLEYQNPFAIKRWNGVQWVVDSSDYEQRYAPVTYVYPLGGNESAVGIDLASHPNSNAALELAEKTGSVTASSGIELAQSEDGEKGILLFAPVYSLAQENNVRGFVLTVLNINQLYSSEIGTLGLKDYSLQVTDESSTESTLLYSSSDSEKKTHAAYQELLSIGQRSWQYHWIQSGASAAVGSQLVPLLFLLVGMIMSAVISGLFYIADQQRLRALSLSTQSKKLASTNQAMLDILSDTDGVWVRDFEKKSFTYAPGYSRLLGFKNVDDKGLQKSETEVLNAIHPEDREHVKTSLDQYLTDIRRNDKSAEILVREYRSKDARGQYRWLRNRARATFDDAGNPIRLIGSSYDITDEKHLELEQRAFLRAVVELFGVWDTEQQRLVRVSPQWTTVLGYREEELLQMPLNELVHVDDVDFIKGSLSQVRDQDPSLTAYKQLPIRLQLINGAVRTFNCRLIRSTADENRVLVVLFDNESVELQVLASVSNNLPVGHYLFDYPSAQMVFYNDEMAKILGYTRKEFDLIKDDWWIELTHPDDVPALLKHRQEFLERNDDQIHTVQNRVRTKSGTYKTLFRSVVVFQRDRDNRPIQFSGTIADVTELENVKTLAAQADQLEKLNKKLAVSNADLERFAYIASHDLQEPLRAVSGYLQLLEEKYHELFDDQGLRYLKHSVEGAARMQQLINDLLAFSKLREEGLAFTRLELSRVLELAKRDFFDQLVEQDINITSKNLSAVSGNLSLLVDLFSNIISNSIKYRSPQRALQIDISSRLHGDYTVIEFEDNGIGIENQHLEKVLELFARLHRREEYPGTGIGLALCKRIAELHGGKIELRSTVGRGTVISVYLMNGFADSDTSEGNISSDKPIELDLS